jgi:hypothetical protein
MSNFGPFGFRFVAPLALEKVFPRIGETAATDAVLALLQQRN